MSSLTIADRTLHFEDVGSGTPILWIHAYPLSGEMWRSQMEIPGFRHVVPDLPGFGRSDPYDHPEDATLHWYGSDLLGLLDHLKLESPIVAGASMGGYIALDLLRVAPSRISGLILVDSRETPDDAAGRERRYATIERIRKERDAHSVVEEMIPDLLGASHRGDERLIEKLRSIMVSASVNGVIAALHAMAERPDNAGPLTETRMPVLIVVGEEDTITTPADAERMASLVDDSKLVRIEGAGHLPAFEQPEVLNQTISDFLEGIEK